MELYFMNVDYYILDIMNSKNFKRSFRKSHTSKTYLNNLYERFHNKIGCIYDSDKIFVGFYKGSCVFVHLNSYNKVIKSEDIVYRGLNGVALSLFEDMYRSKEEFNNWIFKNQLIGTLILDTVKEFNISDELEFMIMHRIQKDRQGNILLFFQILSLTFAIIYALVHIILAVKVVS